jgi:Flp pilus assembly protein CpaB
MRSRIMTLALAVATGAVAVALVYVYVQRLEEDTTEGLKTRPVLYATRALPAGATGAEIIDGRGFELQDVPARYAAPGALSSPDQLANLVLSEDVAAGEQLSSQRFEASVQDAFASEFPKGTEALSLPVENVRGVAGHVAAGDKLNAYVTADAGNAAGEFLAASGIPSSAPIFSLKDSGVTLELIEKIPVVEVQPAPEGSAGASNMVLAVSPKEAALLIHSQEKAALWFTLVTEDDGARS